MRELEYSFDVGVFSQQIGQMVEQGVDGIIGPIQRETHVPFRQRILTQSGQDAQHGDVGIRFNGAAQHRGVTLIGHVVQHYARKPQFRLEGGHACYDGGGGARHFGAVHGEQDRSVEQAGHMGRGTGPAHIAPVKEAAIAFDERKFGRAA